MCFIAVFKGGIHGKKTVASTSMSVPALHATIMLLVSTKLVITLVLVLRDLADIIVKLTSTIAWESTVVMDPRVETE